MKNLLKKNPELFIFLKKIYIFLYRNVLKNKHIYFFLSSEKPISNIYGFDRGKPIDRYYIENFLEKNKDNIYGFCLELLNDNYTKRFGETRITKNTVLDIDKDNLNATLISDLRNLDTIEDNTFNCIILTQVLQFIDDIDSAISECYRILKPGGTLLATLPSISRIDCTSGVDGDFWRFTKASAKYIFEKCFKKENLEIESFGNAKTGIYFFTGLSLEDIPEKILKKNDKDFPLIITVKAKK